MDDEQLPGETGADEPQADVDWQKRYTDTHAEYNRLNEQFRKFESDPNALIEFIEAKHPDLLAPETEYEEPETADEDFDDPRDTEIADLKKQLGEVTTWQQDVESERGEQRFNRDLAKELGDRQVSDRAKAWIKDRTLVLGNNPKALHDAVEDFAELSKEIGGEHIEQVTKSKKTQHVSAGGTAGAKVPDFDNEQERHEWMRQRVRELQQG